MATLPRPPAPIQPPRPDRPPTPNRPKGAAMTLDAIVLGFAQNAILAGLIIITAGVPTW